MAKNVVFFSFSEKDRGVVLTIKGRAVNTQYSNLSFQVQDLLTRWDTKDPSVIRRAITTNINGASRTIVFVGDETHDSYWVSEEVKMTLEQGKAVYAIRLNGTNGKLPKCLIENKITIVDWSEENLQNLATK